MTTTMNDSHMRSITQLAYFLKVGGGIRFQGTSRGEKYAWIEGTLKRFNYRALRKRDKSTIKTYMIKMTGYSDAQMTRLIGRWRVGRPLVARSTKRHRFPKKYTPTDVALLVTTDKAHEKLSGKATKRILEREYGVYCKQDYVRIKDISVGHIYNLRGTRQYRSHTSFFQKTKGTATQIGIRRKPEPYGKPGYIRVDTVHQGDLIEENNYTKGVYHINCVDEVTQWEVVGAVEGISEAFLKPVLEHLIEQFPFHIINFHSDNGSEYINHVIAKLLNKLKVEQTKSRPRKSNDNGLVETKNGAVVRKHFGYHHIPQKHAANINDFYKVYFNPYLNFHRPCGFAETISDSKRIGRTKRLYRTYLTPFEKLREHSNPSDFLKDGHSIKLLEHYALQMSDTEAATRMQKAKQELFKSFKN
jgi:hypothetical protein